MVSCQIKLFDVLEGAMFRDSSLSWLSLIWAHYENMPIQIYWNFYDQKMQIVR